MSELSDQYLLRAWIKGDRAAFDALYRRYAARIYATAYRLTGHWEDAEDTLQEVFVNLALKADSIRCGLALSAWLYRTTINRATDCLRKRPSNISLESDDPRTARVIVMESLRREALDREMKNQEQFLKQIGVLIPLLPQRQAAVFVLHGFQGLAHREIATVLECSEASSRSSYSLACQKVREWIAEQERQELANDQGVNHGCGL